MHHPKFRHLKATVLHRDNHIDNIRHMSQSMPGESDFFHVNAKFAAVPLSGSGGLISILNVRNGYIKFIMNHDLLFFVQVNVFFPFSIEV